MELSVYVGKKVKIDLLNGFFYEGVVLSSDDNSIELKDKTGKLVSIKEETVSFIREIE